MSTHDKSGLQASLAWYRSNYKAVEHYPDQWVAICPEGVLTHHQDVKVVVAEYKKQGHEQPLLYKVPPEGILAV